MAQNDGLRRYFEAALAVSQITRSRAEEVVRDLIRTGEVESTQARDWVEDLVRTSRQRSETFVSTVHSEVRRQLNDLGLGDINDLARRVADILDKAETAARRATGTSRPARWSSSGSDDNQGALEHPQGSGQEDDGKESWSRQEDDNEKGHGQEDDGEEGHRQKGVGSEEDHQGGEEDPHGRQEERRSPAHLTERWSAAGSTPSWCGEGWPPPVKRRAPWCRRAPSSSPDPRRPSPADSSPRANLWW